MENLGYVFAAFVAVWALFFAYLMVLTLRNRALERELEELRALLERRAG